MSTWCFIYPYPVWAVVRKKNLQRYLKCPPEPDILDNDLYNKSNKWHSTKLTRYCEYTGYTYAPRTFEAFQC
jgi:hypothetical protein